MSLTQGVLGNLANRYKAVLKKCRLLNVFGTLAVATALTMGSIAPPAAAEIITLGTTGVDGFEQLHLTKNRLDGILLDGGSINLTRGPEAGEYNPGGTIFFDGNIELDTDILRVASAGQSGKITFIDGAGSVFSGNTMTLKGNSVATNPGSGDRTGNIDAYRLVLAPDAGRDFTADAYLHVMGGSLELAGDRKLVLTSPTSQQSELQLGAAGMYHPYIDKEHDGAIKANIEVGEQGNLKVGGDWKLASGKTIDIQSGGEMTVGLDIHSDTVGLDINGATVTNHITSGFLDVSDAGAHLKTASGAEVKITALGTLLASKKSLTTTADWDNIAEQIAVENGGRLKITGVGNVNLSELSDIRAKLMVGGGGLFETDATIKNFISDNKISAADLQNAVSTIGTFSTSALRQATVTGVAGAVNTLGGAVGSVQLQAGGDTMTVAPDTELTLTGGPDGGNFVNTSTDGLGNLKLESGSVAILGDLDVVGKKGKVADVTLNPNTQIYIVSDTRSGNITTAQAYTGNVNVVGVDLAAQNIGAVGAAVKGITAAGGSLKAGDVYTDALSADNSSLTLNSLTLTNKAEMINGTRATVSTLNSNGSLVVVGTANDTRPTTLSVNSLDLGGGTLFVDPSWGVDPAHTIVATGGNFGNGNQIAGQNSLITFGTSNANWLPGEVRAVTNGAGLTEAGVTAALGVYSAQKLTGSRWNNLLVVDGSITDLNGMAVPAHATFAANSLLVVRADAAKTTDGALSAAQSATANVAAGAKLRITEAEVGNEYKVLGTNFSTTYDDDTAWNGDNLSTDSPMVRLVRLDGDKLGSFGAASDSAADWLPRLDSELVRVVNDTASAYGIGRAAENSAIRGVRFLSRAVSNNYIGGNNPALAAKTVESAARIAEVGAVPQMTVTASEAAAAVVTQRTSLASPRSDLRVMRADGTVEPDRGIRKLGAALWIIPLYQSRNTFGMEAGNFDLDQHGGLGGIALGADYTLENALRFGVAFNLGAGYAEGGGDLAKTANNFTFWGLGAYAGWLYENFGLTADINYTSTYNDVKQDLPSQMNMRNLQSDITAHALGAGLRAEYRFETPVLDITPHAGVRYMHLLTDKYDVKSRGTVLEGEQMQRNIWTFPVGLAFSKSIQTGNGWFVKPSLDLAVIPAAGDIKKTNAARFTGTDTKADLESRIMDHISYSGGAGLEFGNRNVSFGLNYTIQASAHTTAHGVLGTLRYEF
jgi:hypothetical protein